MSPGGLVPEDPVIAMLTRGLTEEPENVGVRVHLAALLVGAGRYVEAREHLERAALRDPANAEIAALGAEIAAATFDWDLASEELDGVIDSQFTEPGTNAPRRTDPSHKALAIEPEPDAGAVTAGAGSITLADVGGMKDVKRYLESSFLAPLRNPEMSRLYGASTNGGLLLYGPPGCGKTFLARAIAGELGFEFLSASPADLLDPYVGASERAVSGLFRQARAAAPCVLFLDEVDGLGGRRSSMQYSPSLRNVVSQLLVELDGIGTSNEGVYVLAATNQPWDVDPALRRPGRFDRTLLVLPPDAEAREAIFGVHLRHRPIEGISLKKIAARSDGMSGADIAFACAVAARAVMLEAIESGTPRTIRTEDVLAALGSAPRSTTAWFESARAVVAYGSDDGTMAELGAYMKRAGLW